MGTGTVKLVYRIEEPMLFHSHIPAIDVAACSAFGNSVVVPTVGTGSAVACDCCCKAVVGTGAGSAATVGAEAVVGSSTPSKSFNP